MQNFAIRYYFFRLGQQWRYYIRVTFPSQLKTKPLMKNQSYTEEDK